jgi:hypothetical protein
MGQMSKYEREQVAAIEAWKKESPGVISTVFGLAVEPAAWLVRKVVPEKAIAAAIDAANSMAAALTDTQDVCREAHVESVGGLRGVDLEVCDRLANNVHNWAIGLAVAEGGATGTMGILGAPVDVPAVLTLALRTVHKIGTCYGYECKSKADKDFALGIMAAAGANSLEEKQAALALLTAIRTILARLTWKKISERAAESQLSKEAAIVALRSLAKQLGINITKRRALVLIPFIGAAVGGSVNGWYLKEVGWAARRSFQERWLVDNLKQGVAEA